MDGRWWKERHEEVDEDRAKKLQASNILQNEQSYDITVG